MQERELSLERKIAIVTGASRLSGIGAAICTALASKGIDVFFTYWTTYDEEMPWGIHSNEPQVLQDKIIEYGVRCEKLELDLSNTLAPAKLLDTVEEKLGKPSILINNATYSVDVGYDTLTAEVLDKHYQVNIRGTMLLSAEFSSRFSYAKGGRIINLTSGQSLGPMAGNIAYATTKGAIDTFTLTLSAEVASKGITVNAVNPGPTDTGWMKDGVKDYILTKSPMGRIGVPQDAARLITFLASDDAEWVTGQIIHSEGGFQRG
ncbi:SDR family oxidoreductase [Paenibacillus sp. HJL G12]|uniref:SDR family oxidoreductase n=1 Tax=Paenibacillus dendrobii TaxID=2691084 RepID=A0A7X3II25_9BACL|nr:SDR family oxidoreductase [Paenibacillus dendrobii]MWV44339.1 SDR family oxidoreductase [Paenibacillus dendrobii]